MGESNVDGVNVPLGSEQSAANSNEITQLQKDASKSLWQEVIKSAIQFWNKKEMPQPALSFNKCLRK